MSLEKKIVLWRKWFKQDIFFIGQILKNSLKKNRIFLFDTANHDNLGNDAIALAEIEFIKQELPEYAIIEVPGGNILRHTKLYKKCLRKSDILTIAGGGFLGSLWPFEEQIVQKILSVFQQNKIIIFPQTFFIEKNDKDFMKVHEGYVNHNNLIICLRDMNSCKRLIEAAPFLEDQILYMPDMVCGLTFNMKMAFKREKVGICFREDKECILKNSDTKDLKDFLYEKGLESVEISTIANRMISPKERKEVVNNKLQEFAKKKLVITDRLHAMIFQLLREHHVLR